MLREQPRAQLSLTAQRHSWENQSSGKSVGNNHLYLWCWVIWKAAYCHRSTRTVPNVALLTVPHSSKSTRSLTRAQTQTAYAGARTLRAEAALSQGRERQLAEARPRGRLRLCPRLRAPCPRPAPSAGWQQPLLVSARRAGAVRTAAGSWRVHAARGESPAKNHTGFQFSSQGTCER